jgi:hypothetical protein
LTWTCLTLVPALAIVALGSGLLPTLAAGSATPTVPGGLLLEETRAFNAQGDDVTGVTAGVVGQSADVGGIDQFMDSWQNTVRKVPSPRR